MIFEAIEFAAKAHHGQYRKATKIPYITHPLNIANLKQTGSTGIQGVEPSRKLI